jgi:hypothetical protein
MARRMSMAFFRRNAPAILFGLMWLLLFQAGLRFYAGSTLVYVAFSAIALGSLLSAIYWQASFGYLFLSVFLWLGFWFKLTANFLLFGRFPFGEPVGAFDSSPAAWDLVLLVASVASLGAVGGRLACSCIPSRAAGKQAISSAPAWYPASRKILWAGLAALTVGAVVCNTVYGVHQIGVVARTIFPWPGNALLAWFLNIGAALSMAVLIGWDRSLGLPVGRSLYAVLAEGFLTSTSVLSRSAFLFHVIPQALALNQAPLRSSRMSASKRWLLVCLFCALFGASIALVSILRDLHYAASHSQPTPQPKAAPSGQSAQPAPMLGSNIAPPPAPAVSSLRLILIHQLAVNRWIGIEGAMAISSYDGKSLQLLLYMLKERREIGTVSAYQAVCNSGYQTDDAKNQFASMPGMPGFLFYSGSFWVVFVGMFGVVLFTVLSEWVVFQLTQNPLVCALYGTMLANTVAQFGVTPRQDVPQFVMVYGFIAAVWAIRALGHGEPPTVFADKIGV